MRQSAPPAVAAKIRQMPRPPQPPRGRRTAAPGRPTIWPVSWPLPATTSTSPGSSIATRRADRLAAVADLARAGRRRQDGGADRGRLLGARIVVGHDDDVGLLAPRSRPSSGACRDRGRRRSRRRTIEPARRVGPQRVQHLCQRVGLVGVVDEDQARRCSSPTRSSRPLTPVSLARDASTRDMSSPAGAMAQPGGDQRVRGLEIARQRQVHVEAPALGVDDQRLPEAVARQPTRAGAARPRAPDREQRAGRARWPPRRPRRRASPSALTTAVAAGGQQRVEQPQLGGEIVLDRRMIVEVVAAEIGEGAAPSSRTPSSRRWSSPWDDASIARCVDALARRASSSVSCSVTGIGRRQRAVDRAGRRHDADGAEARRLPAAGAPGSGG